MFADDTNLFYSHKNIITLYETVNEELHKLSEWFSANSLSLNLKKTKYALFHSRGKRIPTNIPQLFIDNHEIERNKVNKFLGILIHENLTWDDHVNYIKQKISKNLGIFYKTRQILNKKTMTQLYFSFINSYLSYGVTIWGSTCTTTLNPLHVKQKHAARIIFNENRFAHSEPLLTEMKALNIYQLNVFNIACFMFKNVELKETPRVFDTLSIAINNKYDTRLCGDLKTPYCKTLRKQKTISYRGPKIWNAICQAERKEKEEKEKKGENNDVKSDAEEEKTHIFAGLTYHTFKLKVKLHLLNKNVKTEDFY